MNAVRLPVWASKYALAWPGSSTGAGTLTDIRDMLTRIYESDAHFAAYTHVSGLKISKDAIAFSRVTMCAFVVDIDAPKHLNIKGWRASFMRGAVVFPHCPFGYFTRGGARLVWRLAPRVIASLDDGAAWSRWYVRSLLSLAAHVYGMDPDPSCRDWTRLFRVPHGVRDGVYQSHGHACGRVDQIGEWFDSPTSDDDLLRETGESLALASPAWRSAMICAYPPPPEPREPAPIINLDNVKKGAISAINLACNRVRNAGIGSRNTTLFAQARWLGEVAAKGDLLLVDAEALLRDAGLDAGLTGPEIAKTLASARKPRHT